MSDDFEHNVNQRMQDFRIVPGPQIWERVAAALPPERKRRRFAMWWWLLPLAACLGGGIWLGIRKSNKPANAPTQKIATQTPLTENHYQPTEENTTDAITKNDKKQTTVEVKETVPNKKQTGTGIKQPISDKQEVTAKQQLIVNKKETVARKAANKKSGTYQPVTDDYAIHQTTKTTKNSLLKRQSNYAGITNAALDTLLNHAAGNIALQKAAIIDSAFISRQPVLLLPDLMVTKPQESIVEKDSFITQNRDTITATLTQKNTPSAKRTISKTTWSLVLAAGSSSLNSSSQNENKVAYANNLSIGAGSSGNASRQFTNPTAGLNFSAGIVRRQALNKHWNWQAALYYQFLTSHQITGGSNDSLLRFQTFADAAYTIVQLSGNTISTGSITGTASTIGTKRTNQVHRMQIVPGIQFTINPSSKSPISFSAGAAITYNLGNRLLLHDYRSYSYIRSSRFSNNLMIGAEAGIDIFINRKIHTGIFFTHDFTNVAKPQLLSAFHWNQLQLRVGVPLSRHK